MKKGLLIIMVMFCANHIYAQDKLQFNDVNHAANENVRYKLYPTFNMWTFLKLDTQTGKVSMLQFSVESAKNEGELFVGVPLEVYIGDDVVNGRYELYPTTNIWTFIMIDQINGNTYHVQWSNDKMSNNYVKKIEQ